MGIDRNLEKRLQLVPVFKLNLGNPIIRVGCSPDFEHILAVLADDIMMLKLSYSDKVSKVVYTNSTDANAVGFDNADPIFDFDFVLGNHDGTVWLCNHDIAMGESNIKYNLTLLEGKPVYDVGISPRNELAVLQDGILNYFDFAELCKRKGTPLKKKIKAGNMPSAFSYGEHILAVADCEDVKLFKGDPRMPLSKLTHPARVNDVSILGDLMATACDDSYVRLFRLPDCVVCSQQQYPGPVASVDFRKDGKYVAAASENCVYVSELKNG